MLAITDASRICGIGKTGLDELAEYASFPVYAMQGTSAKFLIQFKFVSGIAAHSLAV